jgi:hypothetical protein
VSENRQAESTGLWQEAALATDGNLAAVNCRTKCAQNHAMSPVQNSQRLQTFLHAQPAPWRRKGEGYAWRALPDIGTTPQLKAEDTRVKASIPMIQMLMGPPKNRPRSPT